MQDYAKYQGYMGIVGPRDSVRSAFEMQLITNGEAWMEMILSRNKTVHTYNEKIAGNIFAQILEVYYPEMLAFQKLMTEKIEQLTLFDGG